MTILTAIIYIRVDTRDTLFWPFFPDAGDLCKVLFIYSFRRRQEFHMDLWIDVIFVCFLACSSSLYTSIDVLSLV